MCRVQLRVKEERAESRTVSGPMVTVASSGGEEIHGAIKSAHAWSGLAGTGAWRERVLDCVIE